MAGLETSTRPQIASIGDQNGGNEDNHCSATVVDLEALNCPICYDALTSPIFQCDNGHIVCSTCFNNLVNKKCPSCAIPIGHIRCRAMERVIQAVIVPCPNAKFGCEKKFSYGKETVTHEKECTFTLCSCPAENCDYTGSYKDVYSHFDTHGDEGRYSYRFLFEELFEINFELTEFTSVVMKEYEAGLLFVVQCFREPHGVYVTMSCIAPSALEVGEFSCDIITTCVIVKNCCGMAIKLPKVKRVRKLSLQTPEEDFMLVPSYFLCGSQSLELRIFVHKLNQE